jgi:hypothetical protein
LRLAALALIAVVGGCNAVAGGDCPSGTTFRDPLCVPERFNDPCDLDGDDFLDEACGGNDCDRDDPRVHPRALEVCNGRDDDCDGATDEDTVQADWYRDEDGDGWGGGAPEWRQCAPPVGAVDRGGDCADGAAERHPGAEERCNREDDDCDGFTDEGTLGRYYRDADDDGFGTPYDSVDSCDLPPGFVPAAGDCDDTSGDVRPDQSGDFALPGGVAGFDYDCDGEETPSNAAVVVDCDDCVEPASGWAGPVAPDCGESGTWLVCRYDAGRGCGEQSRRPGEVQRCR